MNEWFFSKLVQNAPFKLEVDEIDNSVYTDITYV